MNIESKVCLVCQEEYMEARENFDFNIDLSNSMQS